MIADNTGIQIGRIPGLQREILINPSEELDKEQNCYQKLCRIL
jgi:hypothetical protein